MEKRKTCGKCGFDIKKASGKIYWIEYWLDGKRKRKRIGSSRKAAENEMAKKLREITEDRYIEKDKNAHVTLGQLKKWYLGLTSTKQLTSYRRTRASLDNVTRIIGSDIKIKAIDLDTLEHYGRQRETEKSRRYPDQLVADATINREIAAIRKMLNEAVRGKKISSNPIRNAPMRKEDNVRKRILTDSEFENLLSKAPEHIRSILLVAFYEGMRYDEIMRLEWSEVDLKDGPGWIRLVKERTKGKREAKSIPLHPRVKKALQELPSRFAAGRVFLKNGKPIYNIRKSFVKALEDAGIEDFVFHDFRHCAVTRLRKAGNDRSTIKKMTGHKTDAMFYRYNLVDEEDLADVVWEKQNSGEEKREVR